MSPRPDPSLLRPRASSGIAQRFFSATTGGGVDAAAGPIGQSGAIADGTLTVFVKREGGADWAKVESAALYVADLKKAIVAELDIKEPLDSLTLHVARDKAGKDVGDALDSSDTLAAVSLLAGAKLVVKVAGAAAAAGTAPGKKSESPLASALFSRVLACPPSSSSRALLSNAGGAGVGAGSEKLMALRKAILEAEPADNFITLAAGAQWPQLGGVPLFVRHFYDACYSGPLQSLTADKSAEHRKFVILGNPGSE